MLILGVWGKTLMKCRAAAIAALLCTIFAGWNAEARGPYGSISVGNWQGGAYTNDQTGLSRTVQPAPDTPAASFFS